jgi:hypothetical protein
MHSRRAVRPAAAAETPWHLPCTEVAQGTPMDLLLVAATVVFFAVTIAYARGCDRL